MREEANRMLFQVAELVRTRAPGKIVEAAFMQFGKPDFFEGAGECIRQGAKTIVIHPYFLAAGDHVTKDVPEMVARISKDHPSVRFVFSKPLGIHDALASVVVDRVYEAIEAPPAVTGRPDLPPDRIESESLSIVETELGKASLPPGELAVLKRVIHATADFSFASTLRFHPKAVQAGVKAIRSGKHILVDIRMLEAGINVETLARHGGRVVCRLSDSDIRDTARESGRTRTEMAIERGLSENVGIVAIGNAPTALFRVMSLMDENPEGGALPDLVVGVPVGFVNAAESKDILSQKPYPFITSLGRKGGTPVAAAIVNALLKLADES